MFSPTSITALNSAYVSAMAVPCHVEILLQGTAEPDLMSGTLGVTVIAEQEPGASPYYLYVAACSHLVPYGYSNFSEFHYPLRKMYPNFNGTLVTFSGVYPETLEFNIPFTFSASWWHLEPDDIYFAVWLQTNKTGDKQIHQSENIEITTFNSVEETPSPVVSSGVFALGIPYPNPFTSVSFVPVFVEKPAVMSLKIFDLTGRAVRELSLGSLVENDLVLEWDGKDDSGAELNAGIYRIELTGDGFKDSKTVIKIK